KDKDQFNSIHEKLINYWKYLKAYLHPGVLHFACIKGFLEDLTNTEYLRDCDLNKATDRCTGIFTASPTKKCLNKF
ncbi:MAG TPA: glutathionylspermidine synthase family protein, partial [Flavisolibacter sp.]|nr:glutathionylspermidine synthase family protein [Flavisolibacter sp.]